MALVKNGTSEALKMFEVIDGGKADIPITKPDGNGIGIDDWLRRLPFESRFLCHGKQNRGCFLESYGVASIMQEAILLYDFNGFRPTPFVWVNSVLFSRDYVFVAILPNPPKEEDVNINEYNTSKSEPCEEHDGHEGPIEGLPSP